MLETDEVDVDLFTATPGTSLASIFSTSQGEQDNENASLRYIPQMPQPPQPSHESVDKTKAKLPTNFILTISVLGYEWVDGTYNMRKNVLLAIFNLHNDKDYNIMLYDSDKKVLSVATVSPVFIINVKKDVSLSYYDNFKKYWMIYAAATKINKIVDCLKSIKVNINYSIDEKAPPEHVNEDIDAELEPKHNTKSDLASNIKSKDTILRKIASMGQSVLPSNDMNTQSSDSTDDHKEVNHQKPPRHKFVKSVSKKGTIDKPVVPSKENISDSNKVVALSKSLSSSQDIALSSTSMSSRHIMNPDFDINNFVTEQRINNTELRINLNRMTDKLEQLLLQNNKDIGFDRLHVSPNQTIVEKLLKEYETKINSYEKIIKSKGFDCNMLIPTSDTSHDGLKLEDDNEKMDNKQLVLLCREKDLEIERLKKELNAIPKIHTNDTDLHKEYEMTLLNNITELKKSVDEKNDLIYKLDSDIQHIMTIFNKSDLSNQIKKIMNETYQTIASNFNDEVNYSGAKIKTIVGTVIKNSTLESINNIGYDSQINKH